MERATNRKMVTLGLLAALFIGALDATVVSTALPHMIEDLNGLRLISWVFSIYTLTTCVTTPIFGKLTDLFGRKTVFAVGLVLFVVGSILCGAAQSMAALIFFRALQGIGAGALTPVTFTIIGDVFPGEERAKMQGVFSSVWSVAGLLGPLVGGYFVDHLTWRWIFYMNVPVGFISFLLVFGFFHEKFERKTKSIDYMGALTFTVAISSFLYALLNGGEQIAWDSPVIIALFAAAVLFMAGFVLVEKRAKEPMLPLSLFKNRTMTICYIVGFFGFCVTSGVTIYSPMWIQNVLGHSATSSGLMLAPMSLAWPFASNLSGRLMYRLGAKVFMTAGTLIVAIGGLWLISLQPGTPYWQLIGILIVIGFGMGCITTPAMVTIQASVGWQMRGVATSTNSLMGALGQTVGVAVYGTLFNSAITGNSADGLAHGMHVVFIVIFTISILHVFTVLFLPGQRKSARQQTAEA